MSGRGIVFAVRQTGTGDCASSTSDRLPNARTIPTPKKPDREKAKLAIVSFSLLPPRPLTWLIGPLESHRAR
jgi:hypothetical protein